MNSDDFVPLYPSVYVCVLLSREFQRISTKFGTSDVLILVEGLIHPSSALEPKGSLPHLQ